MAGTWRLSTQQAFLAHTGFQACLAYLGSGILRQQPILQNREVLPTRNFFPIEPGSMSSWFPLKLRQVLSLFHLAAFNAESKRLLLVHMPQINSALKTRFLYQCVYVGGGGNYKIFLFIFSLVEKRQVVSVKDGV